MSISKITGEKIKTVYHGSPYLFEDINLLKGGFSRDFGQGFYLSDDKEHAYRAGRKKALIVGSPYVYLYTYEIPVNWPTYIQKHVFREANASWLDFVVQNREGKPVKVYDVVYGPTADARTYKVIKGYIMGDYKKVYRNSEEEIKAVIRDLKVSNYARQVCIKTDRAKQLIRRVNMEVFEV